jgi:ATP-dependent helicase/nuclease subunit A
MSGADVQLQLPDAEAPDPRTPQQRAAIELRETDVFTEAGAGTGKTGVLVSRYCDAVTDDGVGPDAILAFTFTERAAGELRERIRRELIERGRAAAEQGDHLRAAEIARAARDGERAFITTIHGFCRRLLAIHPVAAGMDPRFRVLDETEAGRLRERAFAAALDETVARDESVARFASGLRAARLHDMVEAARDRLRTQGVDPPRLPDPGEPARSVKSPKKESPELTPAEAELAREGFAALGALLAAYHAGYEALKADRSAADFSDLELGALALLAGPGPVREAWRERFVHLMVDEFQDTNRVQLALIDALHGPQARLFMVGDEFQSIYRFRHADLDVFRERRSEARTDAGIHERPLRGNFRSRPDVLAAVNFAGGALLPGFAELEAGVATEAEPRGGGPAVELLLTDCSDDRPGRDTGWKAKDVKLEPPPSETSPSSVAEARMLAQRLRALADAGVPRGDMVVLLRAFTHVDAFEEALDRAGLAPYVVGGRGYWSQQQVEDVLRLLGTIANPLDDEFLFGALASPACGVSADTLWLLRDAARDEEGRPLHVWPTLEKRFGESPPDDDALERIPAADLERLERFCGVLGGLRAEAPLHPLESLIDRTISSFDYDLALLLRPDGRRRMANVRKLMRLAREYEEHDGRDLRGFLDFAEERTQRDEREGMAAVQVEGRDGVRVMTVHAAKGLQFPVVAVADLGRGLGVGGQAGDLVLGRLTGEIGDPAGARLGMRLPVAAAESIRLWDLVELCDRELAAEIEEACRLVYVATSRAEERLILSGIYREGDLEPPEALRKSDSALKVLLPALRARGWAGGAGEVALERARAIGGEPAGGPEPLVRVETQTPTADRSAALCRRTPWPGSELPAAENGGPPPLLDALEVAIPTGHLSYSALSDYSRCGYRFYVERVVGLAAPGHLAGDSEADDGPDREADELADPELGPRDRVLAIGNAVHAALEWSARRDWTMPGEAELGAILTRERLAEDPAAAVRAHALVSAWLGSALRQELDAGGARPRPEVPFVLDLAGTVVRGKIDLLAAVADELVVVDFKTDALEGADPGEVARRYQTQRDLYALAAATGGGDGDRPVRAAYCFLEAPERPVVESYDAARLAQARTRLEALVGRIRGGDFRRTESPYPSLCNGCPAAARLCAKPAWRP